MKKPRLSASSHVQEGKNRFAKAPPEATLFETAAEIEARNALHHSLEFFPTPPWAVRAIMEQFPHWTAFPEDFRILEPAAGRGHIVEPLRQMGFRVEATDIHDHGKGYGRMDFTDEDDPTFQLLLSADIDLVMTNPPFRHAATFVRRGLELAEHVLILCRLSYLGSGERQPLHDAHLQAVFVCCERPGMVLGRYDPGASTATDYAWFHYRREPGGYHPYQPSLHFIPPGTRDRLIRPEDVRI